MAKIVELIFTEERRGVGKDGDPIRLVRQLWTKDGLLVAEEDHMAESPFLEFRQMD